MIRRGRLRKRRTDHLSSACATLLPSVRAYDSHLETLHHDDEHPPVLGDNNDLVPFRALSLRIQMQLKPSCPDLWPMRSSLNAGKRPLLTSGEHRKRRRHDYYRPAKLPAGNFGFRPLRLRSLRGLLEPSRPAAGLKKLEIQKGAGRQLSAHKSKGLPAPRSIVT
jgi:hypothetical protein